MSISERSKTLLSRTAFAKELDQAIAKCIDEDKYLSLFILDIDHLQQYTDRYGSQAGDEIIEQIGDLFLRTFTGDVIIGRFGGDEFIGAIIDVKPEQVFALGEQMFSELENDAIRIKVNQELHPIRCTVSIGIATLPIDAKEHGQLINKAEQAVYRAKKAGGHTIVIYEDKDLLTGLLNYFGIIRKLDAVLSSASHKQERVSIISIDIDSLHEINEQLGYEIGNRVLKHFASFLERKFRNKAFLGRYGGDQFIVVLQNYSQDSAFLIAERIRSEVEENTLCIDSDEGQIEVQYHISAGVATFPNEATERVDLLRKAGEALYRAKTTGRNRVCLPTASQMVLKSNYYTRTQLERLSALAKKLGKSEAFLLREALDNLLNRYTER